jgi:filamentous hemagglutinin family protein
MRGLALVVLLCLALAAPGAHAQVVLDGSIGTASGPVPGGTLPDGTTATYLIEESYGLRSGPNLFHSFSRFCIPSTQSAAFTGDPAIERVIGRVTGSTPSLIDGTLRSTIEGADLYLFNPIGIVFSNSARLDLRGSLYLSSANNLRFEDGTVLSTVPTAGEVLSSAAPSAWGFTGVTTPRNISLIRARDLQVPNGETLSIVGGPVVASGVASTPTLLAPGGTIAIASRLSPGEVPVNVADLPARDAEPGALGSINIGPYVRLDVSDPSDLAPSRGRIVIRGGSLSVTSSTLRTDSAMGAADDAPDIDFETTSSILLRSTTRVGVASRGSAHGGGVRLSSDDISLEGLSTVESTASGTA